MFLSSINTQHSVSDLKLACSPHPSSDYSLDWTSPNLSVVDLAVVSIWTVSNRWWISRGNFFRITGLRTDVCSIL